MSKILSEYAYPQARTLFKNFENKYKSQDQYFYITLLQSMGNCRMLMYSDKYNCKTPLGEDRTRV